MMLPQSKCGQEIECHRRDQIVIFRRTDIRAVMRVPGLEADAQTFLVLQRYLHISSLASMWRDRNLSMRLLVDPEIQRRHATGQIDRCASVGVRETGTREACHRRERLQLPERGMFAHPNRAARSWS